MKYLGYVNIKHGTDSCRRFSNGNTIPLTALPHAFAAFAPQTRSVDNGWFYHPHDKCLEGIRLTHQPSPWIRDFSYLCFMPQSEHLYESEDGRWSSYRPENAELNPHYLKVKFLRYGAELLLAPTENGAVIELSFDDWVEKPRFAILPFDFDSVTEVDTANRMVTGYTTSHTDSPFRNDFKCYFAFSFDCNIGDVLKSKDKSQKTSVALSSDKVTVRLALSYVSVEQAMVNLTNDGAGSSFLQAKSAAAAKWENLLSTAKISADEKTMRTFYSCMYRVFLYPTRMHETDKNGKIIHIVPSTGEVKDGYLYTNNGFWDTFRTVYPLYSLLIPEKLNEILKGYLNFYDDTGYLPRWVSPGECGAMPGTLIEAVFADAAVKGILSTHDMHRALKAMIKNAEVPSGNRFQGRKCTDEYKKLGYVPYDKCHESVNETLDCAYGDFCISTVASILGESKTAALYLNRSKNYKNLFDKSEGFFRGKDSNGQFRNEKFDPCLWGRDYTEGSVWQNGFAVQHDIEGLSELYGGTNGLKTKLDELFATPPVFRIGGYGSEIHEMSEMAAADFGQCAISNQPSFHIPYIYTAIGHKEKAQYWIKRIVTEAFSPYDDGFPGDEDNGTMSAWYIFSCLGIYPLCPGKAEYTAGIMCVDSAKIVVGQQEIDVKDAVDGKDTVKHTSLTGGKDNEDFYKQRNCG